MREFRPSTPADGAAIAALLQAAGLHPVVRPEVEQWKYWRARTDWPAARSYVLTDHGQLIAHGAVIPGVLAWGSERASILHVVDWAARPDAAGAGFTLVKRLSRIVDGAISIGGSSQTRQILPHLGFKPAGQATSYVRPLRPLRIFGTRARSPWRLLARFARAVLWTARAPSRGGEEFNVRRITADAVAAVCAAFPTPSPDLAVLERSEGSLRHALDCPLVQMELYGLERSGRLQGYFLIAIAGPQARLADCWMVSRDPADWRALIHCAVRQARQHPRVAELAAWASDPLLADSLSKCGFHRRRTQPLFLMMPPGRAALPGALRVQMLDADAAYLDPQGESLWL
jgi:hypothetical protein